MSLLKGERLKATELAALVALVNTAKPQMVRRTSDSAAVNNSAVLGNDTVLQHTLVANGVYLWKQRLIYTSSAVADIKWDYSVPAGTTWQVAVTCIPPSGSAWQVFDVTGGGNAEGAGVSTSRSALIEGVLIVGSTGGLLVTQWAQQTANGSDTVMKAGSYSSIQQVA